MGAAMTVAHDPSFMDVFADHEISARQPESRRFRFPNGYGASVVWHGRCWCGLYEVGVLDDDRPCYTTPIANDVIIELDEAQVIDTLTRIAALPDNRRQP